jgi:glucose-1-phosphate cytidylyltransferase
MKSDIVTVILCGGRGTRAYPHTQELPKPLLEVNGDPILLHVMRIYAEQGCTRFVLAAGYRPGMIRDFAESLPDAWTVEVVDGGEDTNKGDRVKHARSVAELGDTFMVTYGDGVGDVDLADLLAFHRTHDGLATVTVVPLPSQYGTLELDGSGRVEHFLEKPRLDDHWINAGFMVMDSGVFDGWTGDLEDDVLPALGSRGALYGYRHAGFWKSMDTYKDAVDLETIARTSQAEHGKPPWLRSATVASS